MSCIPILIMGKSGSGKSASLRNFKKEEISLVNVLNKKLPFKSELNDSFLATANYGDIMNFIEKTPKQVVVLDDIGYAMTSEYMATAKQSGYNKFTDMAVHYYELIEFIKNLEGNKRVYLIMHEDKNDFGDVAPKTVGKLLDNQVNFTGYFTIILRAMFSNGKYIFRTQTTGQDVTKTPIGMFEADEIENDLKAVDKAICDYYNIKNESEGK